MAELSFSFFNSSNHEMFCMLPPDHCPAGNNFKFPRVLVVKTKNFVRFISFIDNVKKCDLKDAAGMISSKRERRWVDKHTELTAELLKLGGSETELELFYLDLIKQPSLLAGHSKMNPLSSSLFLELQNIKKLWKLAESFASVSEWRNN
ncbi:uncharacterized protein ACIBXB_020318 isoform 1-T1 [Morphnus guianensis]